MSNIRSPSFFIVGPAPEHIARCIANLRYPHTVLFGLEGLPRAE